MTPDHAGGRSADPAAPVEPPDTVAAHATPAQAPDVSPRDPAATDDGPAPPATGKPAKPGKKKKRKNAMPADDLLMGGGADMPGSKRGVETMFRNVFRSELDLITLAATKANIMISLNGFIVSALMISGAFIYASSPAFLIPACVFMFTAAGSIAFALLSASPERANVPAALWCWLRDMLAGRARLRDFRQRVIRQRESFVTDEPNILIFKDRVKISREEYWEKMQALLGDRQQVYAKMSEQLYWLGLMADRKFRYLNLSYTIFRWGLMASVLAFIGVRLVPADSLQSLASVASRGLGISITESGEEGGSQPVSLKSTYEPSALQQLPDGRLLVVEDEPLRAINLLEIGADGSLTENESADARLLRSFKRKLNDMEALALDDEGQVYAATSHSTNKKGERKPDRELLMRFRVVGNEARELHYYERLVDALRESTQLAGLVARHAPQGIDLSTINIEAMAYDPRHRQLLLGLREPLIDGKSPVLAIGNPQAMFEKNADPEVVALHLLDMKGGGIRGMDHDPERKDFVLTNEVRDTDGKNRSQFWRWSGVAGDAPVHVPMPVLRKMKNVEAVGIAHIDGRQHYLFMSDEGDEASGKTGQYLAIEPR